MIACFSVLFALVVAEEWIYGLLLLANSRRLLQKLTFYLSPFQKIWIPFVRFPFEPTRAFAQSNEFLSLTILGSN
ncbi:unnamed protein product [Blepharisma stoltei]|uniref:Maturase K n=1 Tax=Blepharisma stoltei TaxID=1481888 RepID=A0AAU9IPS1_9CILI|nr:unnamed protein product [Blepharisma stoltei]